MKRPEILGNKPAYRWGHSMSLFEKEGFLLIYGGIDSYGWGDAAGNF